ncbi:heterogeneous nuclear ribonucleoprotein 1-like [Cynara cardunculus var. scolymus]|uniref:heterogeneous nuclear ribonucleoprotein 1-like n=1 Tax=Cynara cardunculus var. scolymus TaxID=59895 RepID=UPI000D63051C|nr:heterogeneous nuclear ribonucleoprotein 1-like [Cynara cardunculus var. scolymus]
MEDVVVMCDKETSRPRGFGFVTFESPETAEKVLKNRFYELKNKRVEVKKAVSKERMSRNFGNYYDTYNAVYNGTTFPFTASSSYGNFGGYYNYGMNGYGFGASYGCEGLSYIYYPYQSFNPSYYANNYQNLCYYADTYSYQSPYYYGNTPYSSKRTHKYRNRTPNVLKDGDDDSNIVIKNAANLVQKLEDLHLGSDGQANGDGDGDGDHTEISEEGLSLDCNGCGDGGGCAVVIDQDLSL